MLAKLCIEQNRPDIILQVLDGWTPRRSALMAYIGSAVASLAMNGYWKSALHFEATYCGEIERSSMTTLRSAPWIPTLLLYSAAQGSQYLTAHRILSYFESVPLPLSLRLRAKTVAPVYKTIKTMHPTLRQLYNQNNKIKRKTLPFQPSELDMNLVLYTYITTLQRFIHTGSVIYQLFPVTRTPATSFILYKYKFPMHNSFINATSNRMPLDVDLDKQPPTTSTNSNNINSKSKSNSANNSNNSKVSHISTISKTNTYEQEHYTIQYIVDDILFLLELFQYHRWQVHRKIKEYDWGSVLSTGLFTSDGGRERNSGAYNSAYKTHKSVIRDRDDLDIDAVDTLTDNSASSTTTSFSTSYDVMPLNTTSSSPPSSGVGFKRQSSPSAPIIPSFMFSLSGERVLIKDYIMTSIKKIQALLQDIPVTDDPQPSSFDALFTDQSSPTHPPPDSTPTTMSISIPLTSVPTNTSGPSLYNTANKAISTATEDPTSSNDNNNSTSDTTTRIITTPTNHSENTVSLINSAEITRQQLHTLEAKQSNIYYNAFSLSEYKFFDMMDIRLSHALARKLKTIFESPKGGACIFNYTTTTTSSSTIASCSKSNNSTIIATATARVYSSDNTKK